MSYPAQPMQSGLGYSGNKIPSGYKTAQIQNFTPEQMQLLQQMIGNVGPDSFLQKLAGGDQSAYAEMEAPALRQFNEVQGNIASRFSGMGQGGQKSSGFKNTMNSAASNFAEQLQGQRLNIRNQAMRDLMTMSNQLMGQRPYDQSLVKREESSGWGGLIGTGLGAAGGFYMGGPAGAFQGANMGYKLGSAF